ncbi:hypothetical protein GWK41_02100 [Persephonella atlantica]|uniref:Uncharacterized protein n=1 Tax=Persephonella atlantica TaxID=2699429 RepID=A0ABS1GG32_9AQUI|nr:hypothetical protein [Persephonella atlantica]MBK3331858.1 hypothetical protein [Persephonella atlantica]
MDILIFLEKHKKKLKELDSVEELDSLIQELKSINNEEIKKINLKNIEKVNQLINEIISEVENRKKEILNYLKNSDVQLKGIKAYNR